MEYIPTEMTQDYLRSIISYDSQTGFMIWQVKRMARTYPGMEAGRLRADGYRHVKIDRKMYLVHRLAWLYVHGRWPEKFIDHINMDRADNRLSNLRECTQSQNGANRLAQVNNDCGTKGIHLVEWPGGALKWKAQIYQTLDGEKIIHYLGCFDDMADAAAAYEAKAKEIYGEFART